MKLVVTTDSTSDISVENQKKHNIHVIPLIVNLGDEEFFDGVNLGIDEIFSYVEKTGMLPKTAARSCQSYIDFFEEVKQKTGADKIIHVSLSSELSCTYSNAKTASEELNYVEVVNSKSLSSGCGALVFSIVDKIKSNKTFEEIMKEANEEVEKVQASFIISNLKYLYKGGRCSATTVFGANVLQIKPKIQLENGKMNVGKKYMGKMEQVVLKYVDDLLKENNPNLKRAFITYTTLNESINAKVVQKLKEKGFKEIITNFAGATIASHCGKNCLGVLFINN